MRPSVLVLGWALAWGFVVGGLNAPAAAAQAASAATPQASEAAQAGVTSAGHGFVAPATWARAARGSAVILEAPDTGSWVALVDVQAQDADGAVAEAWSIYRDEGAPELLTATPIVNRNGWRNGRSYAYRAETGRVLTAEAVQNGNRWAVRIEDLAQAVNGSRGSELRSIREGFTPAGHVRESFAGRTAHRLDAARVQTLTRFVEDARQALGIPGLSIGVIQDGETLFAGGFGEREMGRPEPVDADTLYLMASNTKPLTTLMLAKLVDERALSWETPVVDLLPQFRMADADAAARVQVQHLLCACVGLPYRNLDWEFAPADSEAHLALDILARMRPTSPIGSVYTYSNPIAASGGLVGGHVAYPELELGQAYDRAMDSRVFGPLGMRRTTFDFDRAMQENYARSHGVTPLGDLALIPAGRDRQMHAVRATGGAWSSVNDLLAYVRMELAGGLLPDGTRYISEAALKARWAPQVSTGPQSWYGMGLDTSIASGTPVMFHGGRLYGFRGDTIWLPEHNVGVVILMNASTGNVLMDALPRKLLEVLFDGEPEADSMVAAAVAANAAQREATRRSVRYPADDAHVAQLATRYVNDLLGELRVTKSEQGTGFDFGIWAAPVASRVNANGAVEFVVMTPSPPFPFVVGVDGGRRTLTIRDAQNVYVFVEADAAAGSGS